MQLINKLKIFDAVQSKKNWTSLIFLKLNLQKCFSVNLTANEFCQAFSHGYVYRRNKSQPAEVQNMQLPAVSQKAEIKAGPKSL